MAVLDVRAILGRDLWTRHRFVADVYNDDGTLERGVPVDFASASDVWLELRPTDDLDTLITYKRSESAVTGASFDGNSLGDLYVRYGELPLTKGKSYEGRVIVSNLDNPGGLPLTDFSEDRRTDTIRVLAA